MQYNQSANMPREISSRMGNVSSAIHPLKWMRMLTAMLHTTLNAMHATLYTMDCMA